MLNVDDDILLFYDKESGLTPVGLLLLFGFSVSLILECWRFLSKSFANIKERRKNEKRKN